MKKSSLAILLIYIWVCCAGSIIRVDKGLCDKEYPIDKIVYSKLLCEIKNNT